jgi:hypothetical protein
MTRRVIQLPVTWDRAYRRKDKSLSLAFSTTTEIPTTEFAEIDAIVPAPGYLLFAANRFEDADIPEGDAPSDSKRPSQRLRGVLWHCWDKNTDKTEDFDAYYRRRMERVIEHFKQELD